MVTRTTTFDPGDIFAVPLASGGVGGVVLSRTGFGVALGYFFGPRSSSAAEIAARVPPYAAQTVFSSIFFTNSIEDGTWSAVASIKNFDPSAWPMPVFQYEDPLLRRHFLREFALDDPFGGTARTKPISPRLAARLVPHGTFAPEAIEADLDEALDQAVG